MVKKLVLIGAGGHGKSCVGVIESKTGYRILGFIDTKLSVKDKILGYQVLGGNERIAEFMKDEDVYFLITVGQIRSAGARVQLFEQLEKLKARFVPDVIADSAYVSKHARLGVGTIIMHQAVVNAGARIGNNVILNNHSLVEHDCVIGNHTHISTGSIVNGDCVVGDRVFIGSGSVLVNGVHVASDVLVGAGSVVTSSITEAGTYAGNPARKIK